MKGEHGSIGVDAQDIELKSGFLLKSPEIKSPDEWSLCQKWSKRWFVLTPATLSYFGDREQNDLKRRIALADVSVVKHFVTSNKHKHLLSVRFNIGGDGKQREIFIEGSTDEERASWADAITKVAMDATDRKVVVNKMRRSVSGSVSKVSKKPSFSSKSRETTHGVCGPFSVFRISYLRQGSKC